MKRQIVPQQALCPQAEVPLWVSEMGLEWLYELIVTLATKPARQS